MTWAILSGEKPGREATLISTRFPIGSLGLLNPQRTTSRPSMRSILALLEGEAQVWADIGASGMPSHPAYEMGMPRLSCRLCIFAPRAALLIAGKANPELLDQYCALEAENGHTFQHGRSIAEIRDAIHAGEQPTELHGAWNM